MNSGATPAISMTAQMKLWATDGKAAMKSKKIAAALEVPEMAN